jgi:flagellar hook-basal body complex protein FliE
MAITPIGRIDAVSPAGTGAAAGAKSSGSPFAEILQNAVDAANFTDAKAKADQVAVATGQSDDLHTLMIDVSRADLALQTLVQLRNKAVDAYNEIMKMSL